MLKTLLLCDFDLKSDINVDWNGIERAKPTCFWNSDICGLEWNVPKLFMKNDSHECRSKHY